MASFGIRYDPWFLPMAWSFGGGPNRTVVEVTDGALQVRMGNWFSAAIPRSSIQRVQRIHDYRAAGLPHPGWGVHNDLRGLWRVTGSLQNLVVLDLEPPVRGHTLGFPIHIRRLMLSLEDPDAFVNAVDTHPT